MMFFAFTPLVLLALVFAPRMVDRFRRGLDGTEDERKADSSVSLESRLFRLAVKLGGKLTVSDVVIETGLNTEEAERALDDLVDGHRVRIEVSDEGFTRYEFAEISRRIDGTD